MFKTEYIFARLLVPFIMGIWIFYFYPDITIIHALIAIGAILFCMLLISNRYYKKLKLYQNKFITGLLIFIYFFILGGLLVEFQNQFISKDHFINKESTLLKIFIAEQPQYKNGIARFKAEVFATYKNGIQYSCIGRLIVSIKTDSLKKTVLKIGNVLYIPNKVEATPEVLNPADFNYKGWLANQNIYHSSFLNEAEVIVTGEKAGNKILNFANELRIKQIEKYQKIIKDEEALSIASTLILGYRADLSTETLSNFSTTGTIHALSVSGAHVGIIYFILGFLLKFLDKNKWTKVIKFLTIIFLIWFYAIITGLSAAVVRAAIMISLFIFSKTFHHHTNPYNIFAFSAFCQLVFNPYVLFDVGFQLSYIAVFGLIFLQPIFYKLYQVKNKWVDIIWQYISLCLAAQLITLPLSIYYFHQFPTYFLLGNLFITIPLIIIMYLGILALFIPILILGEVLEFIIIFTNDGLKFISNLPLSTLTAIYIDPLQLILISISLFFLLYSLHKKNTKIIIPALIFFLSYQSLASLNELNHLKQKKILFFSFPNKYCIAFIDGDKAYLKTNLNTDESSFNFSIKPYLNQQKIKTFVKLQGDTATHNFIYKNNQVVFFNHNVLLIDSTFNKKIIKNSLTVNTIFIQERLMLDELSFMKNVNFSSIVINGYKNDYLTKKHSSLAINKKASNYILKKNKAYLINLNQ